jgi:hypothetical protein
MSMSQLHLDVQLRVFNLCDVKTLCCMACVCKEWEGMMAAAEIWKVRAESALKWQNPPEQGWKAWVVHPTAVTIPGIGQIDVSNRTIQGYTPKILDYLTGKWLCQGPVSYPHMSMTHVYFRTSHEGPMAHIITFGGSTQINEALQQASSEALQDESVVKWKLQFINKIV